MRNLAALTIPLLVLSGCPSDDEGNDTGAETGTASMTASTTNGMSTTTGMTSTTTDTGEETTTPAESSSEGGSGTPGGAPVINSVTWTQDAGCTPGTGSDVTIVVDATDPDNDAAELTFSGLIIGCTGEVTAAEVTILCPQVAPYNGTITVEDPDGNSDDIDIEILVCEDGMAS
jgi:hypothetical protein